MGRLRIAFYLAVVFGPWPTLAQSDTVIFYNVDVFDGYRMQRGRTVEDENGIILEVSLPANHRTGIFGLPRDIVVVWIAGRKVDRDAVARMAELSRKNPPPN
jgi:hypothetical protein